jgi:hypothetical protein
MLGGMPGAMSADAPTTPRPNRREYPARSMGGISTLLRAAASATAEPLIQEKPRLTPTLT